MTISSSHDFHVFAGNPLDRAEKERRDPEWLASRANSPSSRFLPVWKLNVPIGVEGQPGLGWLGAGQLDGVELASEPVLLGLSGSRAFFAVDVSELVEPDQQLGLAGQWKFEETRAAAMLLSRADAAVLAQARAVVDWHARHRFCGVCGGRTDPARGGQIRKCAGCGTEHFPRTDPVIITVVGHGEECLLGQSRGRLSQLSMYSALAGFVDQGESIEEAVGREVREEAGIEVANVRYHSSQPWPFPSSLMIGCQAGAVTTEIRPDREEMADVRWFGREEVLLALDGNSTSLKLPGPIAIAHHLIAAWAKSEA